MNGLNEHGKSKGKRRHRESEAESLSFGFKANGASKAVAKMFDVPSAPSASTDRVEAGDDEVMDEEMASHHGKGHGRDERRRGSRRHRVSSAQDIVRLIPNGQRQLFNFEMDWRIVDKHDIVERVMRGWLNDRFREYLGQEEEVLVKFVMDLLKKHNSATKMVTQLRMVLDKDTEQFVVKMWKRLVFEMLKAIHRV